MGRLAAPSARDRRLLRWGCALFLTADVATAAVALAVHGSGAVSGDGQAHGRTGARSTPTSTQAPASPSATPTAAAAQSLALAWMARELPHTAAVLADDTVRGALVTAGFRSAGQPAHPRYTVSTGALRRLAAARPAVAAALHAAVPLAVFPTRDGPLVVGEVVGGSPASVSGHRARDAQLRLSAGRALLRNPTFTATAATRTVLTGGGLDLRTATALALLAANGTVELRSISRVGAESRAGLPARTITFRAAPEAEQRALLQGLTQTYRPQAWTRLGDGSYRATWPIRPDPDDTQR